jgi:NAD(P)H-nitrite reductase large subunit
MAPIYHCYCTNVTQKRVVRAYAAGHHDIDAIQRETRACTGCQSCRGELEQLIALLDRGEIEARATAV